MADTDEPTTVATTLACVAEAALDSLILYLTGHGMVAQDGGLVIATRHTDPRWPEFSGLRYSWVREALRRSPARRTVVIVDCCFSGRAISAMAGPDGLLLGGLDVGGAYVLTSTTSNSTALAPEGARHTAFTGSLLRVLRRGIPGAPPFLRLSDIYEATRKEMLLSGSPQPTQMGTNNIGDLALVRNAAHAPDGGPPAPAQTPAAPSATVPRTPPDQTTLISTRIWITGYDGLSPLARLDANIALINVIDAAARGPGSTPDPGGGSPGRTASWSPFLRAPPVPTRSCACWRSSRRSWPRTTGTVPARRGSACWRSWTSSGHRRRRGLAQRPRLRPWHVVARRKSGSRSCCRIASGETRAAARSRHGSKECRT